MSLENDIEDGNAGTDWKDPKLELEELLHAEAAEMDQASVIAVQEYAQRFAGWDRSRVAGLLVLACYDPRNAWLGMRLTLAIHACAGLADGGVQVPTPVLKQALDKGGKGTAHQLEDPLEGPFLWPVKFDRPARFLGAPIPDDVFYLDTFWDAAQILKGDAGAKVRDMLRIAARIAETMAFRASAPHSAGPGLNKAQGVALPKVAFQQNFKPDWRINPANLTDGLERPQEVATRLASLTTTWEEVSAADPEQSPLLIRPLVQHGDDWLVLCPLHIARAAMHSALETAKSAGVENAFRSALEDVLVEECVKWCDRLGWAPVDHKIVGSNVDDFKIATVTFRTSSRSIVRVAIMAGVPQLGAFQDLALAPRFRLPAKAGSTGLATMFSATKIDFEPNRLRQLFVLAGPACSAAIQDEDVLAGAGNPEILSLPNLVGLFFGTRKDPRRFLRYWDAHAELHARGVIVVPDDFASYCAWNEKETFYLTDDVAPTVMHLDGQFVAKYWQETMDRTQPSFVTRGTTSYQRFKQGHEPEFTIFNRQDGAHEIEHEDELFCVITSAEEHRELARMLSFWTWRLALELNKPLQAIATIALTPTAPAAISVAGQIVTVALGADFQPDADTEARLSIAATHAIRAAYGDEAGQQAEGLRQELLQNPLHRHQRVTDDPSMVEGITDSGDERVRESYRDSIMDWIGPKCMEHFKLTPGTLPADKAKAATDWMWRQTLEYLQQGLNDLNGPASLTVALRLNEQILHRVQGAEFHQPHDEALWSALPTFHEEHLDQWNKVQRDALSTRFLIESLVATAPKGNRILDEELFEQLVSFASSIADWGFADEVLHFGQATDAKVECLASNRVALSMKTSQANRQKLSDQQMLAGVRSHLAEARGAPRIESASLGEVEPLLDACMKGRAGYSLNDFTKCIKNWAAVSLSSGGECIVATREKMLENAKVSPNRAEKVLDDLTLKPRGGILGDASVPLAEIVPWSFNRDQSILWRPICFDGTNYQYAARLLLESADYQLHQYLQGRGPLEGPCAKLYEFVEEHRGKALTNAVAALYSDGSRYIVAKDFKGKPGVTFPPELGDVDVLVFDKKKHRVEVMEAKNYYLAKTPREIRGQHEKLFVTGKKPCMADKHERRVKWVKENLTALLSAFKLTGTDWTVRDCIVMSGYTHHALAQNRVTVVAFSELRHRFAAGKMSA